MSDYRTSKSSDQKGTHTYTRAFDDFEEFTASLCGYDVELSQLERGPFKAGVHQIKCGSVLFSHLTTERRIEVCGDSPPKLVTIGIPTARCEPFTWRRQTTDAGTIQIYRQSTELEMLTSPSFEANDLAMPESSLNALCETLGIVDLDTLVGDAEMLRCDPKAMAELRNELAQIDALLREQPSLVGTPEIQSVIEVELPCLVLNTLLSSQPQRNPSSSLRNGRRCVDRVKEYIKANPHEQITLADMCKVAGVSARTLQYQFETLLKLTPKRYLKIQRLNNAHKGLFASSPTETKVVEIANRYGFWHMGQFAADYRQLFGELPSATLMRFPPTQ